MRKLSLCAALAAVAAAALLLAGCKAEDSPGGPRAAAKAPAAANAGAAGPQGDRSVRHVKPDELLKMLESGEAVAVDVRVKPEYDREHIKGSLSIPRNELPSRFGELPKDKLVVFYCA